MCCHRFSLMNGINGCIARSAIKTQVVITLRTVFRFNWFSSEVLLTIDLICSKYMSHKRLCQKCLNSRAPYCKSYEANDWLHFLMVSTKHENNPSINLVTGFCLTSNPKEFQLFSFKKRGKDLRIGYLLSEICGKYLISKT